MYFRARQSHLGRYLTIHHPILRSSKHVFGQSHQVFDGTRYSSAGTPKAEAAREPG